MTGIIIADKFEIHDFPWKLKEEKNIHQFSFKVFENNLVVVNSGIGIANAAAATQELISSFNVNQLFNYGAVGGNDKVKVYDLITPKHIFYHDVFTPWYKRGQTPGEKEFFTNSLNNLMTNNLASGSSFLADDKCIVDASKELNVDIFDMETAAIAQIADKNNVPLGVIKCVSDAIGQTDTDLEDINTRIAKAGKLAFEELIKIIG